MINIEKLRLKRTKDLNTHNKNLQPIKDYETGQVVFVKQNKRIGSKLNPGYRQELVRENRNTLNFNRIRKDSTQR